MGLRFRVFFSWGYMGSYKWVLGLGFSFLGSIWVVKSGVISRVTVVI